MVRVRKWLYVLWFVITSGGHYFVISLQIPPRDPTTSPRSRGAEIIAIAFCPPSKSMIQDPD